MFKQLLLPLAAAAVWAGVAQARPVPVPVSVLPAQGPSPELQAIIDAHPGGTLEYQPAPRALGTQLDSYGCWSRGFSASANGAWMRVAPRWCGYNGYVQGVNNGNRSFGWGYGPGPPNDRTWGPDVWTGCEWGCSSVGYQWWQPWYTGWPARVTIVWQVYGNGQAWSYGY